jgi:hypothetical protein
VADVGEDGRPGGTPTSNPLALSAAHDLLGGPTNQAQILAQVGVHLTIAGDCYVIGETPVDEMGTPLPDDEWYVASTDELSFRSGSWFIDRGNGKRALDEDRTVIIRVWQSHPKKKWLADSPVRAVLPVLRELRQLVRVAGQQLDSRLAGAGILLLPIGVQFPPPSADALRANPDADPLMLALAENIMTPLEDPEDSSRLVPMTLRVPAEVVDKVKLVTFASQLWEENKALREACIRRLALGLDMPPEQLLGMSDANHWGAWQIEESGVKLHVAPKLTTIVNAINEGYYEPALERLGLDPFRFTLWFDVSELVQRPNRGSDAQWLYDHDELSGVALRRETGFDESDAPSKDERLAKLLAVVTREHPELLNSLVDPLITLWLGGAVSGADVTVPVEQINQGLGGEAVPDADVPTGEVPTGTELPDTQPASLLDMDRQEAMLATATEVRAQAPDMATAEIVCAHLLTNRALELAGKRLLTREIRGTYDGDLRRLHLQMKVTASQLDRLLAGAWDWVPEIAGLVGLDPVMLRAQLQDYVGSLLTSGQPHDVRYLAQVVRKCQRRAA